MYDQRTVGTKFNEPTLLCARFTGAGAAVPTAVTGTSKGFSITRSGVGTLVVTFSDVPLGVPQNFDAWVCSPSADKNVRITPLAAPFVSPYQVSLQVGYHANGVAVDLTTSEELDIECWLARTSNP